MIASKTLAKQLMQDAQKASGILNNSIFAVMETGSEDEVKRYKRAVGRIMGEIWSEILSPIWHAHPDLMPPEMRKAPGGHS